MGTKLEPEKQKWGLKGGNAKKNGCKICGF